MGVLLQLEFLGLTLLVLSEIAASVAYVNHIVRFKSGIDDNETLRRVWTKPELVIFQPVELPIVLSWIFTLGVSILASDILIGFLQIVDALRVGGELTPIGTIVVASAGFGIGTAAGLVLYIADGGKQSVVHLTGLLVIGAINVSVFHNLNSIPLLCGSLVATIVVVLSISFWIRSRGLGSRVSAAAVRDLGNSGFATVSASNTVTKLLPLTFACGILVGVLRILDYCIVKFVENNGYSEYYLAQMLRNFGGLMVLISCSLTAIIYTSATLQLRAFVWQWPALLSPMIFGGIVEIVLDLVQPLNAEKTLTWRTGLTIIRRTCMYGACGFLGAFIYLIVLTRAAMKALDPGVEGQSELIVDDDDSEYDIEA